MKKNPILRLAFLLPLISPILLLHAGEIQAQQGKTKKAIGPAAKIDTISGALLQKTTAKWLPVNDSPSASKHSPVSTPSPT